MKVQKIDIITKKININKTNKILTKPNLTPKIDMFCKSKEVIRALENKFVNLRENFSEKLYPQILKCSISEWNFFINSTDENLKIMNNAQDEYQKLWQNEKIYKEFLKLKNATLNKHEEKQLQDIIKNFEEELNSGEDLKKLREKESEIAQKYNSYIPKIPPGSRRGRWKYRRLCP